MTLEAAAFAAGVALAALCGAAFAAIAVAWAFRVMRRGCLRISADVCGGRTGVWVACAAVLGLMLYAGTKKPVASVVWDEYFTHPSAEIPTNMPQRLVLAWRVAAGCPPTATATLSARVRTAADSNLVTVATVPMTNLALSAIMETDATNYLFWMECSFIPDAPVVTNGVYHVACLGGTNVWVPVGLRIYGDGNAISPPAEAEVEYLRWRVNAIGDVEYYDADEQEGAEPSRSQIETD